MLAGAAVAGAMAFAALRTGALSRNGALAATAVGTMAIVAGWHWGALLIAYFVASSLLSRWGAAGKAARTGAIIEKSGPRDAWQVAANGSVFAMAAVASLAFADWFGEISAFGARLSFGGALPAGPSDTWSLLAAGALAAAAADTWSTELGTMLGGQPRSILSLKPVPAGTSGGITLWGSAGALLGGAFIAAVAVACGWRSADVTPIVIGGVVGAFADSLLGATVQSVRHCPACDARTERAVHDCGAPTRRASGWRWVTNDTVNFAATIAGAVTAVALAAA